jgi:hypothetical protein
MIERHVYNANFTVILFSLMQIPTNVSRLACRFVPCSFPFSGSAGASF